jgi:uncharacterized protein YdeI (YjbR/CyaY-like superfamily)
MTAAQSKETKVPPDFQKALWANTKVKVKWLEITPIARRDFIRWIESAKQSGTRDRRIKVACSKLASGQRRPCCYAVVPMNLYKALNANLRAKAAWKGLSPDARRDIVEKIDSAKDPIAREKQIQKVCDALSMP